jgi:phage-related protein
MSRASVSRERAILLRLFDVACNVGKAIETTTQNVGKAIEKGTQDLGTAGETIGRFVEHELKGIGKTLSDADKRIREGKFVDAIWHMSTDPLKHTEENAFQAAQESNMRIPANADSDSDRSRTAFR